MSIDDIVQIYVNGFGQPLGSGGLPINFNALPQRITALISNVALNIGDCVTLAPGGRCTLATTANLAFGGAVIGVCLFPAFANSLAVVQFDGVLDVSVTGLSASGPTRVNVTTGRLEVVSQFSTNDYPVGYSYGGYVAMVRGLAIGVPTAFDYSQGAGYTDDFLADNAVLTSGLVSSAPSSHGPSALVQATGGSRPTLLPNELNGHSAIHLDGAATFLEQTAWTMGSATDWTFFMIVKNTGTQTGGNIGGVLYGAADGSGRRTSFRTDNVTSPPDNGFWRLENTGSNTFPTNGKTYAVDMRTAGYHLIACRMASTGNREIFVDGASRGTFTNTDPTCYSILTLGRYQAGILYQQANVVRIINYASYLDDTTMGNINTKFHLDYPALP